MNKDQYNAHHSPIGAFASFTLGYPGAKGGFGLELGKPADENFYLGLECGDHVYEALPFFEALESEASRFDVEQSHPDNSNQQITENTQNIQAVVNPFLDFCRDYQVSTDTFYAGDIEFTIGSRVTSVPNPETASDSEMMDSIIPAVFFEITIDNSWHDRPRRGFFGYTGSDPYSAMQQYTSDMTGSFCGIGQGSRTAVFSDDPSVRTATGFTMEEILSQSLEENWSFGLGQTAAFIFDVPANTKQTYHFVGAFYRSGNVTSGMKSTYYYTRYFADIEAVGAYALLNFHRLFAACQNDNMLTESPNLSKEQKWMMAHSIRSYYGSTQFLMDQNQQPLWVVNEGEYRMMNTFDLTVDQVFFELKMNPWTVKNELDLFAQRYSYRDTVSFPGDCAVYEGGISFTHDMGVTNVFSPPGYSSYEKYGLKGCFSHMTHEQLVNWILCAAAYVEATQDLSWEKERLPLFQECFTSMLHRDHPDPDCRTGIMKLDSSRVMGGAEITTYDSLDVSLGQARNNIYLAGKCWATYVSLEKIFAEMDCNELSLEAKDQALRCANTLTGAMTEEGYIPAVLEQDNQSKIIPAIEGLVFPYVTGCKDALKEDGLYGGYLSVLKAHMRTVLTPGVCLFPNHGWKLSSTSNNSWLSKIYLCQFAAYQILGIPRDVHAALADQAHVTWLKHPAQRYYSWSDQMMSGIAIGSKYYPRGVTSILWLLLD